MLRSGLLLLATGFACGAILALGGVAHRTGIVPEIALVALSLGGFAAGSALVTADLMRSSARYYRARAARRHALTAASSSRPSDFSQQPHSRP